MARYRNSDDRPNHRGIAGIARWKFGLGPPSGAGASPTADELAPPPPSAGAERLQGAPRVACDVAALCADVSASATWIGHATFLLRLGGRTILTDPVLERRIAVVPRLVEPGILPDELPPIDVVTVSHNHRDHLDLPSLRRLGPRPTYLVPEGLGAWFKRQGFPKVVELGWWREHTVEGVTFTFVPSHHWSRRGLFDEDASLWGGFLYEAGGTRLYHSGDTAYFDGFREIGRRAGRIDAAMLPIGAYEPRWFMREQHMNPDDAARAFADLGADRFLAMHWGTFKLTDEPIDEPPRFVRHAFEARKLPGEALFIPSVGETVRLSS